MAQGRQDGIREKVSSVREVVQGRSKEEITLVLKHYDDDVERTIQAFLDGHAKDILQEWQKTTHKQPAKKKRNKKPQKEINGDHQQPPSSQINGHSARPSPLTDDLCHSPKSLAESISSTTSSLSTLSMNEEKKAMSPKSNLKPVHQAPKPLNPKSNYQSRKPKAQETPRTRTLSEASTTSDASRKSNHTGLEKSVKDLQRQISSLQRLKAVMSDGFDQSFKSIKITFEQLRECLNNQEAMVLYEMDKVKHEASEILSKRQLLATELKSRSLRAPAMSEQEIALLRADIKHFVSERKLDEDLTYTNRFICDLEESKKLVNNMCSVIPVKTQYQRRSSISSIASSGPSRDDKPQPTESAIPPQPLADDALGAKVVTQSDSLTQFEKSGAPIATIKKSAPPRSGRQNKRSPPPKSPRDDKGKSPSKTPSDPKEIPVENGHRPATDVSAANAKKSRKRQKEKRRQRDEKRSQEREKSVEDSADSEKVDDKPKVNGVDECHEEAPMTNGLPQRSKDHRRPRHTLNNGDINGNTVEQPLS